MKAESAVQGFEENAQGAYVWFVCKSLLRDESEAPAGGEESGGDGGDATAGGETQDGDSGVGSIHADYYATIDNADHGTVTVAPDAGAAPETVENFL